MSSEVDQTTRNLPVEGGDQAAIEHLKTAIASGKHWYLALLEAIALWASPEEMRHDRHYRYLISGEAFDWLLLAERLCAAVNDLIPDGEKTALLFHGRPPIDLGREQFQSLIGSKYQPYLNYFYGVIVEEALVQAVQEEVRKERRALGYAGDRDTTGEVYRRIYGATRAVLLNRFRREKGYPPAESMSLTDLKEFTYWRFKYRLEHCDKTRVASDTRKALRQLDIFGFTHPW
jgi:hypothetical protein